MSWYCGSLDGKCPPLSPRLAAPNSASMMACTTDYFVVHVGEVLNVVHLVADVLQVTTQNVENYVAKGVAYMC